MTPTETTTATKRELEIEIPADDFARETETLIQKYQKLARIPGFRSGHVPASIIRQRFGQEIQNDVMDALIPKFFRKETERLGLIPISQPRVTDLHAHAGEPVHFKASFEVMPEIKVEGYKELRAEHPEIFVTDQEVEDSLKALQEQKATFAPIEGRAIQDADYAQVSLTACRNLKSRAPSLCTWTKFSSKSAARTRCRSSPKTCVAQAPETSAASMFIILMTSRTSACGARLSPTKSRSKPSSRRVFPS